MVSGCSKNDVMAYCLLLTTMSLFGERDHSTKEANNFLCLHPQTPLQLGCRIYQSDALLVCKVGSQSQKIRGQWGLNSGSGKDCYSVQCDPVPRARDVYDQTVVSTDDLMVINFWHKYRLLLAL